MSKLISKYDILQSSKRKKQVIFGSLGSQIVLLILSDSKSRYLLSTLKLATMSDESNVVKLNRTRDPGCGLTVTNILLKIWNIFL